MAEGANKEYSDEIKAAEKLKSEYKQLEAKVYFGDGGTDEEMKRLRQMNDEVKVIEARAADVKEKMLGAQKEYADDAGKRLVDDGIFEQVKLPKTMTPEAVDEIESKVRELYSEYGIMPKKMLFNPLKSGGTYASYRWNEDTLYLGNTIVDPEHFTEYHHKAIEVFNKTQEKLRPLAEKRLAEAEKILSDKSIKGYERHKAQLMKDQALVQLTPERNVVPDTIGEVIEHEYAHFLHNTANRMGGIYEPKKYIGMKKLHGEPDIWDSNNKSGQVAAASISKYAADNPLEAVAEAFVAKRKGYDVPKVLDDILDDIDKAVGKSLDKSAKSDIMKMGKANGNNDQMTPDFSKYNVVDDPEGVLKLKSFISAELHVSEKDIDISKLRNAEVAKPFMERLKKVQTECGLKMPRIVATDLIDDDECCIAGFKPFENTFYISSRYFNSKDALLDTLRDWAKKGFMPKQCTSIKYVAEHEAAHIRIPSDVITSEEAKKIFKKRKLLNDNDAKINEYYADAVAIFRTSNEPDANVVKAIEYLRERGIVI